MTPALAATKADIAARLEKWRTSDPRFRLLEAHIKKFQYRPDALIEVLHKAQDLFGFLEKDVLHFIASLLKLPPGRVYGVATFYHSFTLAPRGEHTCIVCLGTACYVKGASALLAAAVECAGIRPGETTPDDNLSLLTVRCIGACGLAPVVIYDGQTAPKQSVSDVLVRLNAWRATRDEAAVGSEDSPRHRN